MTPTLNLLSPHMLTIGIYANYFPQEYMDETSHQLVGFDIDVIRSLAERLHLQTKFVIEDYSTLINDLASNRFDVVISAVSITPELQKKANFIPYFRGGESLLVSKGNPYRIYALSDLCGRKVALKEGTLEQRELKDISSNCLKDGKTAISVVVCPQYTMSLKQLLEGSVVAIYQDSPVTDYFIKQNPDRFQRGGEIIAANLEGIAVRKNDAPLLNALQKAFAQTRASGNYQNIITKWGLKSGDITTK
jgi:polar amino acid transport system substrate-binding protein